MRLLLSFLLFFSPLAHAQSPYVLVLGVTQDGGYPQAGCNTPNCPDAWEGRRPPLYVTSQAIVDPQTQQRWLIDTTPDFKYQLQLLKTTTQNTLNELAGIFLTHAHMGHYTGLMHLGREDGRKKRESLRHAVHAAVSGKQRSVESVGKFEKH